MNARLRKLRATRPLRAEPLERRDLLAALTLDAQLNGQAAAAAPGPLLQPAEVATLTYQVTNTGSVALQDVAVTIDPGTPGDATDAFTAAPILKPGGTRGTLQQTLPFGVHKFVSHPTLPFIYATVSTGPNLAIINTQTLTTQFINVGVQPSGLAISPDGSRVYVGNQTVNSLAVIDTASGTTLPNISVPEPTRDVAVAANGNLFLVGTTALYQFDPTTELKVGTDLYRNNQPGEIEISPNGDRLYYGYTNVSPSGLRLYDITVNPPVELWTAPITLRASNSKDLNLSRDGSLLAVPSAAGEIGDSISLRRTSDMAILGVLPTGSFPEEIAFSPDSRIAYTVHTAGKIGIWDTTTFLPIDTISAPSSTNISELWVDRSGRYLFAGRGNQTLVFHTGVQLNVGDTNSNALLDVGETWQYSAQATAQLGAQSLVATATANTVEQATTEVTAADTNFYHTRDWQIELQASIAFQDADVAPGPQFVAGSPQTWNYTVTNLSSVPLSNVQVSDDAGTPGDLSDDWLATYLVGDMNGDQLLNPGEVWVFRDTRAAQAGAIVHVATATATGGAFTGSVSNPTHYFGGSAMFSVATQVAGQDASTPPGVAVNAGAPTQITYAVTNTGNVPLNGLHLVDDHGTPLVPNDDLFPAPQTVTAALGQLQRTFANMVVGRFVEHPVLPYLYASLPAANSVAVINTQTLEVESTIFVGSGPQGLAMSIDGKQLYVANATSQFLTVIDTVARVKVADFVFDQVLLDVEVGFDGRLYVLGSNSLMQISPLTGLSVGPNIGVSVRSGELAISPQRDRLYYADYGISPASLYQIDVTANPPVILWESPHGGTSGSNGQDLGISHDGQFISYAAGAGQVGYAIAKYRTSDMQIVGNFNTGAYPREVVYSPDGQHVYTVHTSGNITVWDPHTFLTAGTITATGDVIELAVNKTGNLLFAATTNSLRVYSTGKPSSLNSGDTNRNGRFDPGETWQFRATIPSQLGQHQLVVTAIADSPWGAAVTATHTTHYLGVVPGLTIQYAVNDQAADAPPGPEVLVGRNLAWTAAVTNSGVTPLSQFNVVDNLGRTMAPRIKPGLPVGATTNLGDTNANDQLDPGETWHFANTDTAGPGPRRHRAAVVNAQGVSMTAPNDANYFGVYDLEVLPNVGGQFLLPLSLPPNVSVIVSDARFEIVNSQLRVKDGVSLNTITDQGREILVRALNGGQVLHKLVLHVLSDPYAWHNPALPTDVDGDGLVLPRDVARIINELNALGVQKLYAAVNYGSGRLALDVNRDGELTPYDAALTIIHLNAGGQGVGGGEGEGAAALTPAISFTAPPANSAPTSAAPLVAWRAATEPLPIAAAIPASDLFAAPSPALWSAPQEAPEILDPLTAWAVTSQWTDAAYASSDDDDRADLFDAIADDLAAVLSP